MGLTEVILLVGGIIRRRLMACADQFQEIASIIHQQIVYAAQHSLK